MARRCCALGALAGWLLLVSTLHAGTLGVPQVITSDATSGISLDASRPYTHAFNMAGGNVVINGVTFAAGPFNGGIVPFTYTSTFAGTASGNFAEFPSPGDAVAQMLDPFVHSGPYPQTLTVNGLTPGHLYDARIYYREWAPPFDRSHFATFDEDGLGPLGASLDIDGDASPTANYLSYIFTATAAPLTIAFTPAPGNQSGTFHLSGFSVQDITPEPASLVVWTVLGLGAFGCCWFLRRRKLAR